MDYPRSVDGADAERRRGADLHGRDPGHISIAFLTALVLVPVVVVAGLLADRHLDPALPTDIAGAILRGPIDNAQPMARLRGSLPL